MAKNHKSPAKKSAPKPVAKKAQPAPARSAAVKAPPNGKPAKSSPPMEKSSKKTALRDSTRERLLDQGGEPILAIQDTTEVNLGAHQHRLNLHSGVGRIDSPYAGDVGFKLHPSIVVDAFSYFPLGIADVYVWDRPMEKDEERDYKHLPVAQKESRKWLRVSEHTKTCLQQAAAVVIVQDREGDIFEQFKAVADEHTFLLIRSRGDRNL